MSPLVFWVPVLGRRTRGLAQRHPGADGSSLQLTEPFPSSLAPIGISFRKLKWPVFLPPEINFHSSSESSKPMNYLNEAIIKCGRVERMPENLPNGLGKPDSFSDEITDPTLDPRDWESFRAQAHRMLDDMLGYLRNIRQRPVWQPIPEEVRNRFRSPMPATRSSLADIHQEFMKNILPFAAGNVHPGFMGWVQGGGTPVGMLAEMLAAGMNANLGGRDHVPIEVERQVTRWMQELFGFPQGATGLFVTGTSMGNFIGVVLARNAALGAEVRSVGIAAKPARLAAYASSDVHGCIDKALDLCGLGNDTLRRIPVDSRHRIDLAALEGAIQRDRESGFQPFLVVGTAGTADTGAIDDLAGIADLARRENLWFHVDGACGALAMLAPDLAPKLLGIERADSLAFDFHKWGQVPYDAGFILVRDGNQHRNAFAASAAYLRRETRGLAGGPPWPCDYGPDLSRGFRALKTWITLKAYGARALGAAISRTCALARYLEQRIVQAPDLELLAPVELNIVCFRYRANDPDQVNAKIVLELQESGIVAPSTTLLDGRLAIRAAIVNHRTGRDEMDKLVDNTLAMGRGASPAGGLKRPAAAPPATREILPVVQWEAELREVEKKLAGDPKAVDLRYRRASLFSELGQLGAATNEYLKVLQGEPHHREALNNFARVLVATGHRRAAYLLFKNAVLRHPHDPLSRVNLGNFLLQESEWQEARGQVKHALNHKAEARRQFEQALQIDAGYERAHEGLSYLVAESGDEQKAEWHRRRAFQNRNVIVLPYRGRSAPVPILQLASTTGGNVPLKKFLDDRIFQTFLLLPEFFDLKNPLPAHHLVVNAIGDAEVSSRALVAAQSVLAQTLAPVINSPAAVLATSRANNARRFSTIPGVVTPTTATLPRAQLADPSARDVLCGLGLNFPILLRAPGFHTGMNFLRVESPGELPAALGQLPGQELIVMQFLDSRGPDGKVRKYRAMMIDGRIYPLHLAVSSHWKIHYFTAEMAENPEHRVEDEAFLEDLPGVLGPVALNALEQIQSRLGLDYAGVDFGLNTRGEVLLFEANATMIVNPPDQDKRWNYRWPAYRRIRSAVQKMLMDRAKPQEGQRIATCVPAARFLSSVTGGLGMEDHGPA